MINYFIKNLKSSQEYFYNNTKIIIEIKNEKLSIFKLKKYWISVIIIDDNEILNNFTNICDFLINTFLENICPNNKFKIISNWYIFRKIIEKNMFYKINVKNNIKYKNLNNAFVLINDLNGEIFFDPESKTNKIFSERMKFLYNEYNKEYTIDEEKEESFIKEISGLYEVLEIILKDVRKYKKK